MKYTWLWTDGTNPGFMELSGHMEEYYNELAGGAENRKEIAPFNTLAEIHDVLLVYDGDRAVASASFKARDSSTVEIKRVWVEADHRGRHLSRPMMEKLEQRAKEKGYSRVVLQTRKACVEAVGLYRSLGYSQIPNYPPYDTMPFAVCFAKDL